MRTVIATHRDADGILTISFDDPVRSMNLLTESVMAEFSESIEAAAANPAVKALLICSRKTAFIAGADLKDLVTAFDRGLTPRNGYDLSCSPSNVLRRLETLGKPVAVAINGAALGGGLELCLACHHRVIVNDPRAVVGLPEVKVGLMPGAGGTQRLTRLIGIQAALPLLAEGRSVKPEDALKLGIVHTMVTPEQLFESARAWLATSPEPTQPWDRKGFKVPGGGTTTPAAAQTFMVGSALAAKTTQHNYPAPISILSAVFEGINLPIEAGLKIESQYFGHLLSGSVARNMIRTLFIHKGAADKLERRPLGVPATPVRKLAVLGAGMMGSGIALVVASAGIPVVLLDSTRAAAEHGKAYAERLVGHEIERGRIDSVRAADQLSRIFPTENYSDLAGADFVIEAVFEDGESKADAIRRAEAILARDAIFASSTSKLPIGPLAENSQRPRQFIGMHFVSPVEKMPLVEIIVGRATSKIAIARTMDLAARLKKTPIVVNNNRGFYTTRVLAAYTAEGMMLLSDGVEPALIENAAVAAGMPVGPLAVSDGAALDRQYRTALQAERDLGAKFVPPVNYEILKRFVLELERAGKRTCDGFFEYSADGRKFLWPGLAEIFPLSPHQPSVDDVKRRLLYAQALESARCLEDGVVTHAADADIASILGVGFPAYTGGTLSYIDTIGISTFVAELTRLARVHGQRFRPSRWLRARAAADTPFHTPVRSATSAVS